MTAIKRAFVSVVSSVSLVAVAYYNLVEHERWWSLRFIIMPGALVDFLTGGNFHNGLNTREAFVTFSVSVVFWFLAIFGFISFFSSSRKKEPIQPPETTRGK